MATVPPRPAPPPAGDGETRLRRKIPSWPAAKIVPSNVNMPARVKEGEGPVRGRRGRSSNAPPVAADPRGQSRKRWQHEFGNWRSRPDTSWLEFLHTTQRRAIGHAPSYARRRVSGITLPRPAFSSCRANKVLCPGTESAGRAERVDTSTNPRWGSQHQAKSQAG